MDVFNAFKGIEDDINEAIEGTMPRQAVVTSPAENGGVWVRFTPVDSNAPESWFPSSIADLPAGTSGWVHPLAGGKGRFIATAVVVPITRFLAAQDATTGSNSTQTMQPAGSVAITIPVAGNWRINAIGGFSAQHTAGVSPIVRIRIDTSGGPEVFGPPAVATVWTAQVASHSTTLELPQGDLTVTVEYRRGTTSGTISARNPWLNVSATKV